MQQTITLTLDTQTVLIMCLVLAIVLALYLRFKPDKPQKSTGHSSRKKTQIEREIKRLERMLKDK